MSSSFARSTSRQFWSFIGDLIEALTQRAFDAVRAAAIALYVVFVVLALLAGHRGLRSGAALFVITLVFLMLVGTHWYEPGTKWFSAAVLAGVGAGMMTSRLMRPPPPARRDPRDPWGVNRSNAPPYRVDRGLPVAMTRRRLLRDHSKGGTRDAV